MVSLETYALQILAKHNCNCYTYGGSDADSLLQDLKEAYPDGMDYPFVDVANAILAISRPRPIVRAPYVISWDNGVEACGSIDANSFEEAKDGAIEMLMDWMHTERGTWDEKEPNQEQKDSWDMMIYNAYAEVHKYNKYTDEYEEEWCVPDDTLREIGWVTFEESEE